LIARDTLATLSVLQSLGISIEQKSEVVTIVGKGLQGFHAPDTPLDCDNAGTCSRLMAGVLCTQSFSSTLVGDASLSTRPQARVATPLKALGAKIQLSPSDTMPIQLFPAAFQGGMVDIQVPSAQVKSACLFAGLSGRKKVTITGPIHTRDHTERLFNTLGLPLIQTDDTLQYSPVEGFNSVDFSIAGDISSAVFWCVAASVVPKANVHLNRVGINATRAHVLSVLKRFGAKIHLSNIIEDNEPTADLTIESAANCLTAVTIEADEAPLLIDEFPALSIVAACAKGVSVFKGIGELAHKESHRGKAIVENLVACGVKAYQREDDIVIEGGRLKGGVVSSYHDHRIAMAFLIAGCASQEGVTLDNAEIVDISYPNFIRDLTAIGGQLTQGGEL
jgi:3-phosphoshikimate 1-carboxyvinyltransferase